MVQKSKLSISNLPARPGVYYFLDKNNKIIYIGKAKNLKNRIKSYFTKSVDLTPAKKIMVEKINKIQYTIVTNETEALLLESTLIKKHLPPYNIILKDDKYWQYIKIVNEAFPKIITVRKISNDRSKYFGPYTSGLAVKQIIGLLKKVFPYRTCNRNLSRLPNGRVCLQYHLGRCLGPCEKKCTKKDYEKIVLQVKNFLSGKTDTIINNLKLKMQETADKKEYEKARIFRDQIRAIEKLTIKQKVISTKLENQDYINIYKDKEQAMITLFKVRQGKLLDQLNFTLKKASLFSEPELLEQFTAQYYPQTTDLPKEIVIPFKIEFDKKTIIPQKGDKKKLLQLARDNAKEFFKSQLTSWQKKETMASKKLEELKIILSLKNIPNRIEGYDISNLSGQEAVGSMVVMTNGQLDKNKYRRFKIKTVKGINDTAMISEVIKRRLKNDWPIPDLILIDGGKPQLNAALKVLKNKKISVVSLAKKQEEIYLPHQKNSLKLPRISPALQLLQRLRDEAHRFAINYHHKLRRKKLTK